MHVMALNETLALLFVSHIFFTFYTARLIITFAITFDAVILIFFLFFLEIIKLNFKLMLQWCHGDS